MRVGADIIHPLVCKRFSGEALGCAFYFLIESEFQRCSGVFELSKKSKVYPNRDADRWLAYNSSNINAPA